MKFVQVIELQHVICALFIQKTESKSAVMARNNTLFGYKKTFFFIEIGEVIDFNSYNKKKARAVTGGKNFGHPKLGWGYYKVNDHGKKLNLSSYHWV